MTQSSSPDRTPSPRPVAVGIDVAEARKGLDLVALDARRQVVASAGRLTVPQVAQLVLDEIRPGVVCIDSPSGWSRAGKSRAGERALRGIGITAFSTGADPGDHPFYRWMRVGFSIYEALDPTYQIFRGGSPVGHAIEVFPEATAVLLAGRHRPRGQSKAVFRRRVLAANGVDDALFPTVDRVDAALAALTGLLGLDWTFTAVGDPDEGLIMLPVTELPSSPLVRSGHTGGEPG